MTISLSTDGAVYMVQFTLLFCFPLYPRPSLLYNSAHTLMLPNSTPPPPPPPHYNPMGDRDYTLLDHPTSQTWTSVTDICHDPNLVCCVQVSET